MKKTIAGFVTIFAIALCTSAKAQTPSGFCSNITYLIKSSAKGFQYLQSNFNLDGVGIGNASYSPFGGSLWEKKLAFTTESLAMNKYTELKKLLDNCSVDDVTLSFTKYDITNWGLPGLKVMSKWTLPGLTSYENTEVEMEVIKEDSISTYDLYFKVINPDGVQEDAKVENVEKNKLPLCDALNKIIEAGSTFSDIKGDEIIDGSYYSTVTVEGTTDNKIWGKPIKFTADFISGGTQDEAAKKYEEIANQLSTCKLLPGTFEMSESDLTEIISIKTKTWQPKSANKKYAGLVIELIFEKNFFNGYDVYVSVKY